MFLSTFSTFDAQREGEWEHTLQIESPATDIGSIGNIRRFPVDPIAHRPPGRFGHRQDSFSDVSNPESPPILDCPSSSIPAPIPHSPITSSTLQAYSPTMSTSMATPHTLSFPSSDDDMKEKWEIPVPFNASLEGSPLSPQAEDRHWPPVEAHRRLAARGNTSPSGAPQIYVTPELLNSRAGKPYNISSSTPAFVRGLDNIDIEISSPPRHPPLSSFGRFTAPPSHAERLRRDECSLEPASMGGSPMFPGSYSSPRGTEPDLPSSLSNDNIDMSAERVVPTIRLPRLKTSSLEHPKAPQTVGNLLSPHEPRSADARLPVSPQSQASPHSSTSSSFTSSSPSASSMTFVAFHPAQGASDAHIITEDTSLSDKDLAEYFPPSSQGPMETASKKGAPSRKWTCQYEGCLRTIRRQDRITHVLEHQGKKRYTCNCGASFARSQDQKRHLREQAICRACDRAVGRNGSSGMCPACSKQSRNRGGIISAVSQGRG